MYKDIMLLCKKWYVISNSTWKVENQLKCISTCCKLMGYRNSDIMLYQHMDAKSKQNIIERKKRRLRKLSKAPAKKIPISDFEINENWKIPERKREAIHLSDKSQTSQALLEKEWSRYSKEVRHFEDEKLEAFIAQQTKALNELYLESPSLHKAALRSERDFSDFVCEGPVQTLPIIDYLPPLGGYVNCPPPNFEDI